MEFFNKAKVVRLKSHLGKYLVADDDEYSVRQNRNGSSRKARWTVEFVEKNSHVVRLKSCHGLYLTASDEPAGILGVTGKKVIQALPASKKDNSGEWEPINEGFQVKLRAKGGNFLRANGATPPWRNSVTHDLPHRTMTQDWVLWDVDMLDVSISDDYSENFLEGESCASPASNVSSFSDDFSFSSDITNSTACVVSQTASPSFTASIGSSVRTLGRQDGGMEFFDKAKAVRLQSHLGKYLVADEDEETVRQSRNGSSHKARWTVEFIEGRNNVIRLKSCHGLYLTATDEPFLLNTTGAKVLQKLPTKMDSTIEWEPMKEGFHVKLRSSEGKFLRANGGAPPWRNSITHDIPNRTATQDWVLWGVDVVDILMSDSESLRSCVSSGSSLSSFADDFSSSPDVGSSGPMVVSGRSRHYASIVTSSGMELFRKARIVRLRSHHDKYLLAEDDKESVCQDRASQCRNARWTVEFVEGVPNVIRLQSCYGKYLTATDEQFLLGVTGRKVLQKLPRKLDSSIEWEPVRDGFQVRLKTRYGNYLRANGGLPPLRNSITHDIPHRHMDWILWEVDVLETRPDSQPKTIPQPDPPEDLDLTSTSINLRSPRSSDTESIRSLTSFEGRMIYYRVAKDDGFVDDAFEEQSFTFKGNGLVQLTQKLEEETGLDGIIVCSRNPLNGQLYPLRLALPPNASTMHIVVVPSTSQAATAFMAGTPHSSLPGL